MVVATELTVDGLRSSDGVAKEHHKGALSISDRLAVAYAGNTS
ncbi:hypothetical protein [Shewanella sp. KX20019]|nr:hypothetical protein [Shewanella sp. KX20019]